MGRGEIGSEQAERWIGNEPNITLAVMRTNEFCVQLFRKVFSPFQATTEPCTFQSRHLSSHKQLVLSPVLIYFSPQLGLALTSLTLGATSVINFQC